MKWLLLNWLRRCRCATAACFKSISCNRVGFVASAALPMLASNQLAANEMAASLPLRYRWLLEIDKLQLNWLLLGCFAAAALPLVA
jgi:hypothetical protein